VAWEVELTDEFTDWYLSLLDDTATEALTARIDLLADVGPALGRPVVDSIQGSRHHNMKELRSGTIRVLFAFDPSSHAILLIGGDKRDSWTEFYAWAIPKADDLFDAHLTEGER